MALTDLRDLSQQFAEVSDRIANLAKQPKNNDMVQINTLRANIEKIIRQAAADPQGAVLQYDCPIAGATVNMALPDDIEFDGNTAFSMSKPLYAKFHRLIAVETGVSLQL